jgi:hypothetical protein
MNWPRFEHLYVIFAPGAFPYRAKLGISDKAKRRRSEIKRYLKPMFGNVKVYAIGFPVLYAYQIEQRLHRFFQKMQYNGLRHINGGSEWFWSPNVISCLLLYFVRLYLGREYTLLPFFALFCPLPIDYIILTLLIAAFQWALILGGFYGAMWALNLF